MYEGRKKIIEGFKNEIFQLIHVFHSDGQRSDSPAIPEPRIDE